MKNFKQINEAIKQEDFSWLGRDEFISDFSKTLLQENTSTHYCLNGIWGSGKTTIVAGIMDKLSNKSTSSDALVIYFDAWKYEHYEHPLFALLKIISESFPSIYDVIKQEHSKRGLRLPISINTGFISIEPKVEDTSQVEAIFNKAEYIDLLSNMISTALSSYKHEKSNKIIIFVDELDRAKPDFALRVLEVFHHLQDDLPTHLVYLVDMTQLNGIIKHYYGYDYNFEIFTHKVFDTIIPLKRVDKFYLKKYLENYLSLLNVRYSFSGIFDRILELFSDEILGSLRTINKLCDNIAIRLSEGYFKSEGFGTNRSYYFLGQDLLWAYVELMIIFENIYLQNPISVREYTRGQNLDELARIILPYLSNPNLELSILIIESYNYDLDNSPRVLQSSDLTLDIVENALSKIMNPPNTEYYSNRSVFNDYF